MLTFYLLFYWLKYVSIDLNMLIFLIDWLEIHLLWWIYFYISKKTHSANEVYFNWFQYVSLNKQCFNWFKYSKCLKSERSDFGIFEKCSIPKRFRFRTVSEIRAISFRFKTFGYIKRSSLATEQKKWTEHKFVRFSKSNTIVFGLPNRMFGFRHFTVVFFIFSCPPFFMANVPLP